MAGWQDYANFHKRYDSATSGFDLGFRENKVYRSDALRDYYIKQLQQKNEVPEADEKRGFLDRSMDLLMTGAYTSAGFVNGLIDGGVDEDGNAKPDISPLKGAWEGFKAGNPFGKGNKKGEITYSDVLETAGWKPESTLGKVAKGTLGFGLDILLDPSTYASFGGTALLKGTGRSVKAIEQLGKLGEDVAKAGHLNFIDDLVAKGTAPDVAKQLADAELAKGAFHSTDEITHMTEDMAKTLIKRQTTARGVVKTDEELANSATKFADEYNRIVGIRDAKGNGTISFGLGNGILFPNKLKKFTVDFGGEKAVGQMRALSDKLKVSEGYSRLRGAVYGSQIGKMFSTTSPLYKLAEKDPVQLWEGLEFVEHTRGLKMDKLQSEKAIRDRFKSFGLSPAENKEVLDLLQNKTVWHKIAEMKKVTDLAKFQEVKDTFTTASQTTKSELDDLMEKRDVTKTMQDAVDTNLVSNREVLDTLNNEYKEKLATLDTKTISDVEDMNKVITSLDEEITKIDSVRPPDETQRNLDALDELHALSKEERKAMDQHMETKKEETEPVINNELPVNGKPSRNQYKDGELHKELTKKHKAIQRQIDKLNKKEESNATVIKDMEYRKFQLSQQLKKAQEEGRKTKKIENQMAKIDRDMEKVKGESNLHIGDDGVAKQGDVKTLRGELHQIRRQMEDNKVYRGEKDTRNDFVVDEKTKENQMYTGDGVKENVNLDKVLERADKSPGRVNTQKLNEALSNYIYGESGHLTTIRDSNVDELMKLIKEGETPSAIRMHIEENPALYAPHMQDVYQFIAEELGYKSWHGDGFKEPLGKLLGKSEEELKNITTLDLHKEASARMAEGKFSDMQTQEFMRLLQLDLKRRMAVNEYSKMTPSEFTIHRTEIADQRLLEDFNVSEEGMLDLKRQTFADDTSAKENFKPSGFNDKDYTSEFAKLQSADRIQVVNDLIAKGIFKKDAVFQAMNGQNAGLYKHMNAIVDEVGALLSNQFKKNYPDLTRDQQNLIFKMAINNIRKGQHGVDEIVSRRALQEMNRRAKEDAVKAVEKEVAPGHDLHFTKDNTTYRGIVESVERNEDDLISYTVKVPTSGEVITGVKPSDVTKVRKGNVSRSPEEILGNPVVQVDTAKKEELIKQLHEVQAEKTKYMGKSTKDREDMVKFYEKRVSEQKDTILKLENDHAEYTKLLKSDLSDEAVEAVSKRLEEIEKTLDSDDALEVWMRSHNQSDVELLKDPERYSRIKREDMNSGEFGSTGADGVVLSNNMDKKIFFGALKQRAEKLYGSDYTYEQLKKIIDTPEKLERFVAEHEMSHFKNKDWESIRNADGSMNRTPGDLNDPKTASIEKRADYDALDMLKNFDVDKMLLDINRDMNPVNSGRIWLEDLASSEKVERTVRTLRSLFDEMGEKEIEIGKLTQEQFDGMLGQYVPHILTPDGEEYFAKMKELTEHGSKVSHDLGYGVVYNPHASGRTIKGGTIEKINKYFRDKLKGKNLFSENVADVYLARALTHEKLIYDDKYMRTMMNVFGKEIPSDGIIEEGYKAVMNHGMLKATSSDIASMNTSVHISDAVTGFLTSNAQQFKQMAVMSGQDEQAFIKAQIDQFLKTNFPDKRISELFQGFHKQSIKDARLSEQILGREGVPMVEMSSEQITGMRQAWDQAYNNQLQSLDRAMKSAMKRGDMERVAEVQKNMEKFGKRTPPQIKQVNEAIIQKANQTRQLQQAKDQSRFLQMYDKFLHFMKLNQTVITPAFHARNKVSNAYLNWLGVGVDAVNKDLQIATIALAKHDGDVGKILEEGKFGHKQLSRPINIENPHQSLLDALDLNNGQLHWQDLYELAVRYDVIDNGAFAHDIGAGAGTKGLFKKLRRTRKDGSIMNLDPTDTENFALYKAGTKVGTVVENGDRLLHFASQLKNGKSIDEAAKSTEKFLFDYSDLTAFEQSVMKRIFPYYTWLRKNGRLQVSQLIEQPGKFRDVAKVYTGIEHMTPEDERMNQAYLGGWAQDWLQMPWDVTTEPARVGADGKLIPAKKEHVLFNPALPFMDLNRIPDPTRPMDSLKELFTQSAPQIKVPVEQATNKNVFLDSPIVEEGDNPLMKRIGHLMSQFGVSNYAGNILGSDSPADLGMALASATTGAKATSVDYETSKYMMMDKMNEEGMSFDDALGTTVGTIAKRAVGNMGESLAKGASSTIKGMFGAPPVKAGEYENALRPISSEHYNKLSDKEKKKYTLPTNDEGASYNKKAVELEKKAYKETGMVTKFAWTLLDKLKGGDVDSDIGYVTKVSDGDTFHVKIGDKESEVRMLLVDTPETVDPRKPVMPGGHEASDYSKKTLINKDVKLIFEGEKLDKYGRLLAYVQLDGKDYNKELLNKGMAHVRYTQKNYPNQDEVFNRTQEYYDAEKKASQSKKGIWQYDGYATPRADEDYKLNAVARYLAKLNQ